MTHPRFLPFAVLLMAMGPLSIQAQAQDQDLGVSESAVRAAVAADLPSWWHLETFEILSVDGDAVATTLPGKEPVPAVAAGMDIGEKPSSAPQQTVRFSATLRLTDQIYEPLYALDGTAMVREIMGPGYVIEVTGSLDIIGEGAEFGPLHLDQGGVEDLGRPLGGFALPALIEGSEAADAFLAARDEVRAQGTMNKIMNDAGEEL